jgi:hypothetical protein
MATVIETIFSGDFPADASFAEVERKMREFVGRTITTKHGKEQQYYRISGISRDPLWKQRVHRDWMVEYFKERHDLELKHLNLPVFICSGVIKIPPELAYLEEEDEEDVFRWSRFKKYRHIQ